MREVHTLQDTKLWFEAAKPTTTPKTFQTQLGVHFEEVAEMLETLTPNDRLTAEIIDDTKQCLETLSRYLKESGKVVSLLPEDRVAYLDALCDQIVTAVGCAHDATDMDIVGAMNEVNRSNYSKFENGKPVFDANMKIQKGVNYRKAELAPFI